MNSGQKQNKTLAAPKEKDCSLDAIFKAFKFNHPEEMALWIPIRYVDLSKFESPKKLDGLKKLFSGKILTSRLDISAKPRKLKLSLDVSGTVVYTNIIGPEIIEWEKYSVGMKVIFEGISTALGTSFFIKSSELVASGDIGGIIPVYKGKHKYSSREIRNAIGQLAFSNFDYLGKSICEKIWLGQAYDRNWLESVIKVIRWCHYPDNMKDAEFALKKIKDLSVRYMVEMALSTTKDKNIDSSISVSADYIGELSKRLKFTLTGQQKSVIKEIYSGLKSKKRMLRLINGDVGTGKTETYLLPCIAAHMEGTNVGIMVPNELLARAIARRIHEIEPKCNVKLVLGQKDDGIYDGSILVGTSAIVHRAKKYKIRFGVVVIDEEQKFSVEQKSSLLSDNTNVIYSTATCIPRTGALIQYGNVEISILSECPVEKKIIPRIISDFKFDDFFKYLKKYIADGKQSIVIFNSVNFKEEKKNTEGKIVSRATKSKSLDKNIELFKNEFGGDVDVLHGQMDSDSKNLVIENMMNGKTKILLATVIIEIGITLPGVFSATVFDADFLGLSQLHQLRGRVARHGGVGDFNMIPSTQCSEDGFAKLKVLKENNDGFKVAEKDLEMRGFGDLSFDSESQSGDSNGLFCCVPIWPVDVSDYMKKIKIV